MEILEAFLPKDLINIAIEYYATLHYRYHPLVQLQDKPELRLAYRLIDIAELNLGNIGKLIADYGHTAMRYAIAAYGTVDEFKSIPDPDKNDPMFLCSAMRSMRRNISMILFLGGSGFRWGPSTLAYAAGCDHFEGCLRMETFITQIGICSLSIALSAALLCDNDYGLERVEYILTHRSVIRFIGSHLTDAARCEHRDSVARMRLIRPYIGEVTNYPFIFAIISKVCVLEKVQYLAETMTTEEIEKMPSTVVQYMELVRSGVDNGLEILKYLVGKGFPVV